MGTGCKSRSILTSRRRGLSPLVNSKAPRCRMWTHEYHLAHRQWLRGRRVRYRRLSRRSTCTRDAPPPTSTSTCDQETTLSSRCQLRTLCFSLNMTRTVSTSRRSRIKTWPTPTKGQRRTRLSSPRLQKRRIRSCPSQVSSCRRRTPGMPAAHNPLHSVNQVKACP